MVRVALAALRLACVVVLYIFLYRVCRVLVLDASSDGASHSTSIEQVFNHRSAEDSPDAGDDVVWWHAILDGVRDIGWFLPMGLVLTVTSSYFTDVTLWL